MGRPPRSMLRGRGFLVGEVLHPAVQDEGEFAGEFPYVGDGLEGLAVLAGQFGGRLVAVELRKGLPEHPLARVDLELPLLDHVSDVSLEGRSAMLELRNATLECYKFYSTTEPGKHSVG